MSGTVAQFSSELVERIRQNDGLFELSRGRVVLLPGCFGFCTGVNRAVTKLNEVVSGLHDGRPVWLLGAMIHNPAVNEAFAAAGVTVSYCAEEVFAKATPHDVFVIPAFGLPLELDGRLRTFVAEDGLIVDATCPFVRRVWREAEQAGKQGRAVIIHGKYGHQESYGIWSRAVANAPACALVSTVEEARRFADDWRALDPVRIHHEEALATRDWTLLNQTTMLSTETAEIAEILQSTAWHRGDVSMAGTLCTATRERQKAAQELCGKECDVIIVLGGTDSSNTTQLYRMAVDCLGEKRCFFVQSEQDIMPGKLRHFLPLEQRWECSAGEAIVHARRIGIMTGASCPDSELEKLLRKLETMRPPSSPLA